jgi:hypothetical protein
MSCEEIPTFSIQIDMYLSNGKMYEFVAVIGDPVCPLVNPKKLKREYGVTVSVTIILN